MPGRQKREAIAVEMKWFIEIRRRRLHFANAPFHELDRWRRGKNPAMRANMIGVCMRNTAGFAIIARVEREEGVEQADGFVVCKQV